MKKVNFEKNIRLCWLTVMVIMILTPADIFVKDASGISSVLCPPCYNWNGFFCQAPPPECKCCFGTCCWTHLCFDCLGSIINPCVYLCEPDSCEGCKDGGCVTDACYLNSRFADFTGIKCACEGGRCDPPGSILYDFFCDKQCYGNCYCEETMGLQVVEERPICQNIIWEPGCIDISDCVFKGWHVIIDWDTALCNCKHI